MQEKVLDAIRQADDIEIGEIICAIIRRKDELYPEWETVFLVLPKKDVGERRRSLEWAVRMLLEEKL